MTTRPILAVACACLACRAPTSSHEATLRAAHAAIIQAHRDRDAEAWTSLETDTILTANRGSVETSTRAERLPGRREYFRTTTFSIYRDIAPPIVRVSADGSQGWVIANVEVVAHPDTVGATDSTHVIWAWIELYERRAGRWVMVGNLSNERPAPPVP